MEQMTEQMTERALISVLSWWDTVGVETPPLSPARVKPAKVAHRAPSRAPSKLPSKAAPKTTSPKPEPDVATNGALIDAATAMAKKCKTLSALKTAVEGFDAGGLSDSARRAVFARGNPDADIMIIGEAPGPKEDAAGKPFIGRAGQLLDTVLAQIGLNEDTLYITNLVNWRPANNRKPTEAEIALCMPIITRHIALVKPRILVLVGSAAMTAFTGQKGITKCRGEWHTVDVDGVKTPALITYHPAYLLRQPHLKKDVWRDMLALYEQASRQAELG